MKRSKAPRRGAGKGRKPAPARNKVPARHPSDQDRATEEFGAAFKTFQKRDFARARDQFSTLIEKYPAEREISERARSYLQICERSLQPPAPTLRDAADHYNQGVFFMNQRNLEEAGRMFEKALSFEPDNEKFLYAYASCFALAGRRDEAVVCLRRAIDINPSNRAMAARDSDFDAMRDHEEFASLVHGGKEKGE